MFIIYVVLRINMCVFMCLYYILSSTPIYRYIIHVRVVLFWLPSWTESSKDLAIIAAIAIRDLIPCWWRGVTYTVKIPILITTDFRGIKFFPETNDKRLLLNSSFLEVFF
jgi:hypothetical protein